MASFSIRGNIAILTVNNPPVNAISHQVRNDLKAGIEKANRISSIKSIIIYGGEKFLAGADIKEFDSDNRSIVPLSFLCGFIEESKKPVISAIEGFALGGGLEVAISSHYRIAHHNTIFGFPEVDLGILPAATGTQRFPRLVGLKAALDYIPTGQRFSAARALEIGVIDKAVDKDVLEEAIRFAHEIDRFPVASKRTSQLTVKDAHLAKSLETAAINKANRRSPGLLAPLFAIKSVMASLSGSFEEGLEKEMNFGLYLFTSGQHKALRYAFLAQRTATQWSLPDGSSSRKTKPKPIKSVAVIGGGTMGTGIAMAALNAGLSVHLMEQNQKFLDKAVDSLKSLFRGSVTLGKISAEVALKRMNNLLPTVSYDSLRNVDLVVEAVFENMKVKQEVFMKLDEVCKADAILCTNTSGLSIDQIASVTKKPERVIGTHFFVPAYFMKLLENVRGQHTSPETIATASYFGQRLGKVPVLVGNCDGFVGNRMFHPLTTEARFLLEEGCLPEEVDQIAEDFGLPMGPFKVSDLSGLDIGVSQWKERAASLKIKIDSDTRYFNGSRVSPLSIILYDNKRLGRKTGAGWYDYEHPGSKVPYNSDFVKDMIIKYRKENNILRRKISSQEIIERLLYGLINEGFKILEEGIVMKPEEIDTIWLLGYGWPRQTGGPMFYASTVGLKNLYEKIVSYSKQHVTSPHWQPSALLKRLAAENIPLSQWQTRRDTSSRL